MKPLLEEHKQLFVYERTLGNQILFVVANFSEEPAELPVSFDLEGEVLITNNDNVSHKIKPYQAFAILR